MRGCDGCDSSRHHSRPSSGIPTPSSWRRHLTLSWSRLLLLLVSWAIGLLLQSCKKVENAYLNFVEQNWTLFTILAFMKWNLMKLADFLCFELLDCIEPRQIIPWVEATVFDWLTVAAAATQSPPEAAAEGVVEFPAVVVEFPELLLFWAACWRSGHSTLLTFHNQGLV